MRKRFGKVLSMVAVAGMIFSTPIGVNASPASLDNSESSESTEAEYAEGEAVILYSATSKNAKKFKEGSTIFGDVEVVETYDFETENSSVMKVSSSANTGSTGFKVSLVKSDKYSTQELVKKLNADSNVQYAEPNYRIHVLDTDDTYSKYQWALENKGQNGGTEELDVNAGNLEDPQDEEERIIALVDTGIDYKHEDLEGVAWTNTKRSNSFKGEHGYDFINMDEDPMDDNGHGTHCSGIMAGIADNGKGISGIATDGNVKIMGLKILDNEGYGYGFEAIGAYNYIYKAQNEGFNVVAVNNSWGGGGDESGIFQMLIDLVGENGAISVCAAGNESSDNDVEYTVPACIDSQYVLSVAASNEKDELATFSNYGKTTVELAAPGTDILSTVIEDTFNPGIYEGDEKKKLCQVYESFEEKQPVQVIDELGYIEEEQSDDGKEENESSEPSQENEENLFAYGLGSESGSGEVKVEVVQDTFFGEKKETHASLKWSITGAENGEDYVLYLPYEAAVSGSALYSSVMVKAQGPEGEGDPFFGFGFSTLEVMDSTLDEKGVYRESSEAYLNGVYVNDGNYWSHLSGKVASSVKKKSTRAMKLVLTAGEDGDYVVYIDDFGVSAANVDTKEFGKYDFYNGTSMATPYVTGAVAAVANQYPEEDALNRKARIVGSVRKSDALEKYTISGGVLDLAGIDNPRVMIQGMAAHEGVLYLDGYYLDGANITVNGKEAKLLGDGENENSMQLDVSEYENTMIQVAVEKDGVSVSQDYYVSIGTPYDYQGMGAMTMNGGGMVSDGEKVYYINGSGNVYSVKMEQALQAISQGTDGNDLTDGGTADIPDDGQEPVPDDPVNVDFQNNERNDVSAGIVEFDRSGSSYSTDLFGTEYSYVMDYTMDAVTDFVYTGHTIYSILKIDTGYSEKSILAAYSEENGWEKAADLPNQVSDMTGYTLAAYNGMVYLIGGFDTVNGTASKSVFCYDSKEGEWKNAGELPEARCFAKALQVGDKLVITLGSNGANKAFPSNILFDGKSFTKKGAALKEVYDTSVFSYKDSENKDADVVYYDAQIGLVKDGIIYAGLSVNGLGDTFIYNAAKDVYEGTNYSFKNSMFDGDTTFAVTADNRLYVINGYAYIEDADEWEIMKTRTLERIGKKDELIDLLEALYSGSMSVEDTVFISSMDIDRGVIEVRDESTEGAYVEGAGYYLPGEDIVLTAAAQEDYEITGFTVNGETVADGKWEGSLTESGATVLAAVQVEKKVVPNQEKETPDSETETPETGKSDTQTTEIQTPETQTPGTQTPGTQTPGTQTPGTETPGTQTPGTQTPGTETPGTQTPSTQATTTEAPAAQKLKKGTVVKKGSLKYKVTSNTSSKKTVTCTGVTSKNVKSVTIPGTITVNGTKFKVTAIGDKAFKNCKKLQKVTVGKNITKVGKNVFKGCKKLKTVTCKASSSKVMKELKKQVKKQTKIAVVDYK